MLEVDLAELIAGRKALEQWQVPTDFTAKVEELAKGIKSDKLFNQADMRFLLDAMVLAEFVKYRPTEQMHLIDQSAQWPDGQIGTPQKPIDIEITEVLEEGRKRGDQYRNDQRRGDGTAEEWRKRALAIPDQLEKAIQRKMRKGYAGKCVLLLYLNMSNYGVLQKETEAAIAAIKAKYAADFQDICVLWQEKLL